jgi:hypothetical protein
MRRMFLVIVVGALIAAMLGLSALPAFASHLDDGDLNGFDGLDDDTEAINDDEDDDGEGDWACIPLTANNLDAANANDLYDADANDLYDTGTNDLDDAIFFVAGPTDCPEGFRAELVLGIGDDEEEEEEDE